MTDLMNEAGEWGSLALEERPFRGELCAAAADLDLLVEYLEEVGAMLGDSTDEEEGPALAAEVSGWAGRLARIVVAMKGRLAE